MAVRMANAGTPGAERADSGGRIQIVGNPAWWIVRQMQLRTSRSDVPTL